MYYPKELLLINFKNAKASSQEEFISEATHNLLTTWVDGEDGSGLYKHSGMYWEVLYPLLQKYQPELLQKYLNCLAEEFDYFNEQVREKVDYGNDLLNLLAALQYISERSDSYSLPGDVHMIDMGDDDIIAYIPNQNIDQAQYWGREDE